MWSRNSVVKNKKAQSNQAMVAPGLPSRANTNHLQKGHPRPSSQSTLPHKGSVCLYHTEETMKF